MQCTGGDCARQVDFGIKHQTMMAEKRLHFAECRAESELTHGAKGCPTKIPSIAERVNCVDGTAGEYDCSAVDLLGYVGMEDLGSSETNDIWGWTDPELGNEIAIVSCFDGTTFVDVTDPVSPIVLGKLDTHTVGSDWGDIKIYEDVAYIGAEAEDHGMQIFDMLTLRDLYGKRAEKGTVRSIPEQLHYAGFVAAQAIPIPSQCDFQGGSDRIVFTAGFFPQHCAERGHGLPLRRRLQDLRGRPPHHRRHQRPHA